LREAFLYRQASWDRADRRRVGRDAFIRAGRACRAQLADAVEPEVSADQLPPASAVRYHEALHRLPQPVFVFECFCDAWLVEASPESLEAFLNQLVAGGSAEDRLSLGFYLACEGRNIEAIRVFRDTLAQHPGSASAWFYKAQVESATLDFDTALRIPAHAAEGAARLVLSAELRGEPMEPLIRVLVKALQMQPPRSGMMQQFIYYDS
jgi:hypothetical protein